MIPDDVRAKLIEIRDWASTPSNADVAGIETVIETINEILREDDERRA